MKNMEILHHTYNGCDEHRDHIREDLLTETKGTLAVVSDRKTASVRSLLAMIAWGFAVAKGSLQQACRAGVSYDGKPK
jgi:hypothetical protein